MRHEDSERKRELAASDITRKVELGRRDISRMVDFGRQVGEEMVMVEAGEFLMGSTDADTDASSDERPQHTVYLDAYAIGVHPVTVAQYWAFCVATRRSMPRAPSWGWLDDHPVVNVTWHDATAYCEWARKRLPTEAEWEKAARGTDGRISPWSSNWNPRAAHCDCKHECEWSGKTAPVGSHPEGVSPCGCHDMVGNVWEWCADWYDGSYYRKSPGTHGVPWQNPKGPGSGYSRVLRGGSCWTNYLNLLRAAIRDWHDPGTRNVNWGFRCAQDLD